MGLNSTRIRHFARRTCSRISNRPSQLKARVEDLIHRTDEFDERVACSGFNKSVTQVESFELFNHWRHILFKIPRDETKILHHSANSIDKLLHIHLDMLLEQTKDKRQDFGPLPLLPDDLTTGIYAWGRTAPDYETSPVRAEALFEKFLKISVNSKRQKQIYSPSSDMYSALVYCWSQSFRNDRASEKCLHWFRKIRGDRSMKVDSATWNALLRIHVRQKMFSGIGRNLIKDYSSLNNGYTFVSLVEGWMNSGLLDSPRNAYEELQRGIAFCMDRGQIPALKKLLLLFLTQSSEKGNSFEFERVMNQAIRIQENHTELEILDLRHFIVVMKALAAEGNFDKTRDLYQELKILNERGAQRLQPNYQVLVIFLSAIVKKKDLRSLEMGEELLLAIETCMLENQPTDKNITNHAYNVMMEFYVRSPHVNDKRKHVENLIKRMNQLSIEYNNSHLLPDKVSYAALMKAIIKEGKKDFLSEIDAILDALEHCTDLLLDRKIYGIVLQTFIKRDDNTALLRAKDLVERMKKHTELQPDRVIYTMLIKIHSLFNDVYGSDKELRTMIQAYDSGQTDCHPNEEVFVTAMNTWEKSGRRDSTDGAFRIFNLMVALYMKGNPECQPSLKSFGKLMVILSKSKHDSKVQMGRRLFSEMEKYSVNPDVSFFNWYIRVCATTNSQRRSDQRASWKEALDTFHMLRENGSANSYTYNSTFYACGSLLHNHDDQYSLFRDIFSKCQNDGQVNRRILVSLKRIIPSRLYRDLTTLDPRENGIHMRKVPASWKNRI